MWTHMPVTCVCLLLWDFCMKISPGFILHFSKTCHQLRFNCGLFSNLCFSLDTSFNIGELFSGAKGTYLATL